MGSLKTALGDGLADRSARPTTDAVTRGVIYQINLRAFTPEGTLAAAKEKLPKIAELGATIVYLCPFMLSDDDSRQEFWSPRQKKSGMNNPRNPYRIKDYFSVDPEYGTEADLHAFVDAAHELGLKVLFDLVYLHCGPTAVFIEDHPDFVKRDEQGGILNAAWGFPGLNFESPELREYLWSNIELWTRDFNVDGFRLDVGDGVPLDFWLEVRKRLDAIRPGMILFSEGTRREDQLETMDLNYGFPFFDALNAVMAGKKSAAEISKSWTNVAGERPKGARFARYFDNHDIANDDYENRRETRWGDAGVRMALALIFTVDGTPMLYNGQEIADANRHSIFGKLPIDWSKAETQAGRDRFAYVQKLIKMRREHAAFTSPELEWLTPDNPDDCAAFLRKSADETVWCVFNLTQTPKRENFRLPDGRAFVEPLISSTGLLLKDGELSVDLPAYGFAVVKLVPLKVDENK